MRMRYLTYYLFVSSVTSTFEEKFDALLHATSEKFEENKKTIEMVNIEKLLFKKSDELKYKDMILCILERMKKTYIKNKIMQETHVSNQRIKETQNNNKKEKTYDHNEITCIYLQVERNKFNYIIFYKILIDIFEHIQKLKNDIKTYKPSKKIFKYFDYKKDILNIDLNDALPDFDENLNGDTLDFVFFINHCSSIEFKMTLHNFYSLFHEIYRNQNISLSLNFVISDNGDGKNKTFFDYPNYWNIYKNFEKSFIYGCGSHDYYDLKKYYNIKFPYMIISEHNELKEKDNNIFIMKYNEIKLYIYNNNQLKFLNGVCCIYKINYTKNLDLDSIEDLNKEQINKNDGYKPSKTDLLVNIITISFNKRGDGHLLQKKIYFKEITLKLENTNKTIFLVKEFENDNASIRDYFIEQIRNLENIYKKTTNKSDMNINQELHTSIISNILNDINSLSPCFLYNNLELIFTRINYNIHFLQYTLSQKNIFFFNGGYCTAMLESESYVRKLSSIPFNELIHYLKTKMPDIEQIHHFLFSLHKIVNLDQQQINFHSNVANDNIKELYFYENIDRLDLNDGLFIRINFDETIQDFYVFFITYISNKDIYTKEFYNSITKLDQDILDTHDKFLLFKYKEMLYSDISNVMNYVENFSKIILSHLSISSANNATCARSSRNKFSNITVSKSKLLSIIDNAPHNSLYESLFYILFTNILFSHAPNDTMSIITINSDLITPKNLNWTLYFDIFCKSYYSRCLKDIKIAINKYDFISKINTFFKKMTFENIEQFWEVLNSINLNKLADIFISENKNMFDKFKESEKNVLIDFFKDLFVQIILDIRKKIHNSKDSKIKLRVIIFEREYYIDELDFKLYSVIKDFFCDNKTGEHELKNKNS